MAHTLMSELLDFSRRVTGCGDVVGETADWVRWVDEKRMRHSINYRPPIEYEQLHRSNP